MRDYTIIVPLGKLIIKLPDNCCAFCSHCTDLFYNYTNGPYLFICDLDNKPSAWDTCTEFDDVEGDTTND